MGKEPNANPDWFKLLLANVKSETVVSAETCLHNVFTETGLYRVFREICLHHVFRDVSLPRLYRDPSPTRHL